MDTNQWTVSSNISGNLALYEVSGRGHVCVVCVWGDVVCVCWGGVVCVGVGVGCVWGGGVVCVWGVYWLLTNALLYVYSLIAFVDST